MKIAEQKKLPLNSFKPTTRGVLHNNTVNRSKSEHVVLKKWKLTRCLYSTARPARFCMQKMRKIAKFPIFLIFFGNLGAGNWQINRTPCWLAKISFIWKIPRFLCSLFGHEASPTVSARLQNAESPPQMTFFDKKTRTKKWGRKFSQFYLKPSVHRVWGEKIYGVRRLMSPDENRWAKKVALKFV